MRHQTRDRHRSLQRHATRMLAGARRPDYLGQALSAYTRAIQAHRRLMKLAPRIFDAAVVAHEARQRKLDEQWWALWEPHINQAYGHCVPDPEPGGSSAPLPDAARCKNGAEKMQFHSNEVWWSSRNQLPPRRQQRVLAELAEWKFWINAGSRALDRYQFCQPHGLPSFESLARLLETAMTLKRLASGLETCQTLPPSKNLSHEQTLAELARSYPVNPTS